MIFAGHETTANVLMWSFYFLALHSLWQERIHKEGQDRDFAYSTEADLAAYQSLDWFIKETMRMRPPVWSFGRIAILADEIHGEKVRPGDLISLSPFLIHHHADYWDRPEEFLPERFAKAPVNYTYIPFGLGPRICMGERLAYLEMRVFLLSTVKHFRFSLSENSEGVKLNPQVSLRPNKDIILKVERRV
jgi:cytochrome P450